MNRAEGVRLLARYFDGELSAEEKRQLMAALAADQDLYNAFAEEALLAENLRESGFRAKVAAAAQPRVGRSLPFLGGWHPRWQLAGAAALALILVCVLILYRANPRTDGTMTKGGAAPVVERQAPTVLAVVLVPTERSQGGGPQQIVLSNQQTVRLQMDPGRASYRAYRATLVSLDTPFRREFDGLQRSMSQASATQLVVEVPSSLLPSGDFTLTVSGVTAAGTVEPVAGYTFSVEWKR